MSGDILDLALTQQISGIDIPDGSDNTNIVLTALDQNKNLSDFSFQGIEDIFHIQNFFYSQTEEEICWNRSQLYGCH